LPFNVDVLLTTGPDYFNSIYITSTDFTKGKIKRVGNNGTLTFSKMEGLPYSISMFMEVSKTYKYDILRTIEAKNGTLIFKGDFTCFEIVDIPTGNRITSNK